jgi:hypothetical protein
MPRLDVAGFGRLSDLINVIAIRSSCTSHVVRLRGAVDVKRGDGGGGHRVLWNLCSMRGHG